MSQEQGWVNLLQQKFTKQHTDKHYKVINSSTSGDTTAGGLNRLPQMLSEHRPDIVIIELGANDGLRGLSLKQMKSNLAKMIALTKKSDAQAVLAGMHIPPNYGERFTRQFHQVYLDLEREHGITLIPFLLDQVGGIDNLIQADGMHPNAKAQPLILDNVWQHIETLLKL